METIIPVENQGPLKAVQGFLKKLLETGVVEVLMVPMRTPSGTITPALVTDPEMLSAADPLAPVLPVNGATLAGKLSVKEPRARVGAVLRSCELRALVELTKMQQASLDSLVLIAVDCAGTYSVPNFLKLETADGGPQTAAPLWQELFQSASEQPGAVKPELRLACKVCEQPVYTPRPDRDITIQLIGFDPRQEIHITLPDAMAETLGLAGAPVSAGGRPAISGARPAISGARPAALEKLISARIAARDAEFASIRARLEGDDGLPGVFSACIRCHNCMTVCPICYCKTCVFKSAIFDHDPMQFITWTKQKGVYRLPADTMLFHMTRLNHMSLSCVGCGMCTEACPSELPVGLVFRAIGQRVQATFEYTPGRSLEDPLPLITFKTDEWTEVGE